MGEIISQGAITVLASHLFGQVFELCKKVVCLDYSKQVAFGETKGICDLYKRQHLNGDLSVENFLSGQENSTTNSIEQCVTEGTNEVVPERKLTRSKSIDGIQGIASIIIAMFHFGQIYPVGKLFKGGWWVVELFFVISASC